MIVSLPLSPGVVFSQPDVFEEEEVAVVTLDLAVVAVVPLVSVESG